MTENDLVIYELKSNKDELTQQKQKLNLIDKELEKIRRVRENVMEVYLDSKKLFDVNLIINQIKKDLEFLKEDLNLLDKELPDKVKDALWEILTIVRDFYLDKESEKMETEEEIRRLQNEINEILEVVNNRKKER